MCHLYHEFQPFGKFSFASERFAWTDPTQATPMFGLLTSTAPAEEAAKPPPSPLHTAELKMNLSSEKWSPTHGAEIKLHVEMTEEDHARREAVTKRKAKDLAKRTALAEKEAQERRWLKRQEEKARYTEQQRSYFEQQVHESTHKTQEELRLESQVRGHVIPERRVRLQ